MKKTEEKSSAERLSKKFSHGRQPFKGKAQALPGLGAFVALQLTS